MKKKEFIKMVNNGDVDDTQEFWEKIYDLITSERDKEIVEMIERIEIKGNRIGKFEMGEKVIEFANELKGEITSTIINLITNTNK